MISSYPIEEVIRGRTGTIRFTPKGFEVYGDDPNKGAGIPARLGDRVLKPADTVEVERLKNNTRALWENFLECVRMCNRKTFSPPELGAGLHNRIDGRAKLSHGQGVVLGQGKAKESGGRRELGNPLGEAK